MSPATQQRIAAMLPSASRAPHGSRSRYKHARCRCLQCRAANSRYVTERERARKEGDTRDLVDAGPARAHVLALSQRGMGYKMVAECAGVSLSVMQRIRSGERKQLRAHTARRILAVEYAVEALGDGALIDAGPTWKLLDELIGGGYTKTQLATWLLGRPALALQIRRDRITAATALKVRKLYEDINEGRMRREK